MQPRVSIVVPSYNHARYVPQCVESVLAQTMPDWELIVVDDQSTDHSVEVWRSYDDSRIKVFENEKNLGTYGNQNRGVSLASSDLIAILDSDDFWKPDKLSQQLEVLARYPDAALCYTLGWRSPDGNPYEHRDDNHNSWPRSEVQELLPWLLDGNHVLASSVLFRREWAKFEDGLRYSGDWIALFHAAIEHSLVCVPEHLVYWRIHAQNSFQVKEGVTREEIGVRLELMRHADRWLTGRWPVPDIRRGLGSCSLHLAALYVLWSEMALARRAARYAVRHYPNRKAALRRWLICCLPHDIAFKRLWPQADKPFKRQDHDFSPSFSLG